MADLELLKKLREAGVKSATFESVMVPGSGEGVAFEQRVVTVEFFPRSLLDLPGLDAPVDPMESPTDRPPPSAPEDGQPNLPPAMQRVLSRKSVS